MNSTSRSANSTPDNFGRYKKDPLDFLGDHSGLVNLDNLVPPPAKTVSQTNSNNLSMSSHSMQMTQVNPFAGTSLLTSGASGGSTQPVNPFHLQNAVAKPSINEIREKQQQVSVGGGGFGNNGNNGTSPGTGRQPANNPWSPVKENPFG